MYGRPDSRVQYTFKSPAVDRDNSKYFQWKYIHNKIDILVFAKYTDSFE